ncbi:1,4-beta-xylanase [Paraconexibacter algicola]|uniref:Beta-xylanase n=1 Tax=Paraconexibacter algicola TaxID=2133960 RepID=A0A2T4UKV5_9ACTN|nr:1,4-beta-xylanase [Paraconexibacter algicola]
MAGVRPLRPGLRRPGPPRLPLPRALVPVAGPHDPRQDDPRGPEPPRRVLTRRRVLTVLLLGGILLGALLVAALVRESNVGGEPNGPVPLRELAARDGRDVGTAVPGPALKNYAGYREELAREFSTLTPENAMKWDAIEPERGTLNWTDADAAVDFARRHDMAVRGHTLIWHNQIPRWLTDGGFSREQLDGIVREHVRRTVGRYRGRVFEWDVLNELTADDGSGYRRSLWSDTLGPDFPARVLRWAREADPDAKLYWNEIAADGISAKSDRFYAFAKALKAAGAPLDGVGFQAHFNLDGVPKGFEENLRRFSDLGLDVRVTELDVALQLPADDTARARQADIYAQVVRACRRVDRCKGITVWGFTDRFSWIPETQPGFGDATLLDRELEPKPAYRAFAAALQAPTP